MGRLIDFQQLRRDRLVKVQREMAARDIGAVPRGRLLAGHEADQRGNQKDTQRPRNHD